MKKMKYSILEKELLEWAYRNKYIINKKIWKAQLISERAINYEMGASPDLISILASGNNVKAAKEFADNYSEDFKQIIWTPTGLVEHNCFFSGAKPSVSEGEYNKFLESGEQPISNLIMYHGPMIQNWRNQHITIAARKENALVVVTFSTDPNRIGHIEDTLEGDSNVEIIFYHDKLKNRRDPTSQLMYWMRELELQNDKSGKKPDSNFPFPTYTRFEIDRFKAAKSRESYRAILDNLAAAINNTKE